MIGCGTGGSEKKGHIIRYCENESGAEDAPGSFKIGGKEDYGI